MRGPRKYPTSALASADTGSITSTQVPAIAGQTRAAPRHRPAIAIRMPIAAMTRAITSESPSTGVVALTTSEDDGTVSSAVRAAARGYLLEGADQEEVVRAITTVAGGGAVFGAALARRIAEFFTTGPAGPETAFPQLTAREREVLHLLTAGRTNAQIAATLYLSPKTVRNNVSNVLAKQQVTDRAQASCGPATRGSGADPREWRSGGTRSARYDDLLAAAPGAEDRRRVARAAVAGGVRGAPPGRHGAGLDG